MTNAEIIKLQPVGTLARTLEFVLSGKYCDLKEKQIKCVIDETNRRGLKVDMENCCKLCFRRWLKEVYLYEI